MSRTCRRTYSEQPLAHTFVWYQDSVGKSIPWLPGMIAGDSPCTQKSYAMKTSKRAAKKRKEEFPSIETAIEQIDVQYGVAIEALYQAIKSKLGIAADSYITGYWHKHDAIDPEMPEWEKEFDRKYADTFEVIIGMAKSYGLDPRTYMTEYFTACSIHGDGVPCRLQEFLPWNLSTQQIERYKQPMLYE